MMGHPSMADSRELAEYKAAKERAKIEWALALWLVFFCELACVMLGGWPG